MKRMVTRLALFASVSFYLAKATPAQAQDYHVILLDQTGSMATTADPASSATFWDNAVSAAQAWIRRDLITGGTTQRAYAIWTFFDNACPGCGGGTQNGGRQVWPALTGSGSTTTSADCGTSTATSFQPFSANLGFCVVNRGAVAASVAYPAIATRLGDLGTLDPNSIRTAFRAITGVGNTPLATSLCQSLEQLQLARSAFNKVLTLETDAGENDSTGPCSSTISTTNLSPSATTFNFAVPDFGLSVDVTHPSWQANVMRRWVRIAGTGTSPSTDPTIDLANATAAVRDPIPAGAPRPTGFALRVDAHFRICHPTDGPPCPPTTALATMPGINLPGLGVVSQVMEPKGITRAPATPSFPLSPAVTAPLSVKTATTSALVGAAAATVAATAAGVPLIDTNEFLFLQALGHVNSNSTFHAIVADSAVIFGTVHKRPGDVDDSNCVDGADLNIVKQQDVYYQRAVQPLQIAIRADLNRDGWVTKADAQIVLDNWGNGCINNPGPKPKL